MSGTWMINTGGRAVKADEGQLEDAKSRNWRVYPSIKLKEGEPTVRYFPQYDTRNGTGNTHFVDYDDLAEVLVCEVI